MNTLRRSVYLDMCACAFMRECLCDCMRFCVHKLTHFSLYYNSQNVQKTQHQCCHMAGIHDWYLPWVLTCLILKGERESASHTHHLLKLRRCEWRMCCVGCQLNLHIVLLSNLILSLADCRLTVKTCMPEGA